MAIEVQTMTVWDRGSWLACATLWQREMAGFIRQRSRWISAVATPVVFWLLLGNGLNKAVPDMGGYLRYFFPGTLVMIVMFAAIFSAYSVIEDRTSGFLQGVLVAPTPRWSIVLGMVGGGATIATLRGLVFLLLWPVLGSWPGWLAVLAAVGMLFVIAVAMMSIGFALAWPMRSTGGFHEALNLALFPTWFLSGAFFPFDWAPIWLKILMVVNPLTYGQTALAAALRPDDTAGTGPVGTVWSATIMVAVAACLFWLAVRRATATD